MSTKRPPFIGCAPRTKPFINHGQGAQSAPYALAMKSKA